MKKRNIFYIITSQFFLLYIFLPQGLNAADYNIVGACGSDDWGCDICDGLTFISNIASMVMYFISAAVLAAMILGSFYLILSHGEQEKVQKGKQIITAAIVGLCGVVFAWVVANSVISVLAGNPIESVGEKTPIFADFEDYKQTKWYDLSFSACEDPVSTCVGALVGAPCKNPQSSPGGGKIGGYCLAKKDETTKCVAEDDCRCVTLCEKLAVKYPANYGEHRCVPTSNLSDTGKHDNAIGECLEGLYCGYNEDRKVIAKCCDTNKDPAWYTAIDSWWGVEDYFDGK